MQTIQRLLKDHRSPIKGIAILWVVFFHAQLGLSGLLYDVQKIGYGGVDLFFFLSGFGLYHSLEQSSEGYLKRRAMRLLPAYVPFCLLWLAVMIPLSGLGFAGMVRTAVGNLFMVGFFSGAPININWYVSALSLSLLVAPALRAMLGGEEGFLKRGLWLILGAFALGLAFVGQESYMAISRLPVFVLGMIAAGWKGKVPRGLGVGLAAGFVCGLAVLMIAFAKFPELLSDYAMYWHPFVLIAPAMCVGLGWLFAHCPQRALKPLSMLGEASFEIFLFNAWAELLGKRYGLCSTPMQWVLWSLASIVLGTLYHMAVRWAWPKILKKS